MKEIDQYLLSIKYPSNSVRIPRSLTKHLKFKANELRAICLFGFPAFCTVLPLAYARHFLLLVIAMHIAESQLISASDILKMGLLFERFLRLYPSLYTERHNTQAVHSLQHIAASVEDYGPLSNYSTFNFEAALGLFFILVRIRF
jgi:hypothetical protein